MKTQLKLLDADTYGAAFKQTQAGEEVLLELTMLFYDIESFDRDNPHLTSYHEGQRSVIRHIYQKIMIAEQAHEQQQDADNDNMEI